MGLFNIPSSILLSFCRILYLIYHDEVSELCKNACTVDGVSADRQQVMKKKLKSKQGSMDR